MDTGTLMPSEIVRSTSEQALFESEARTRAILDAAVDAIITIDEDGHVESMNPAAERLFGYPASEVIGQNVKMLMPEPYRHEHDGYLHNYLTTGHKKIIGIGREVVGLRKDGTTFPMHLAVSELQLGDRRMFTGIARDITDLRSAIRQLEDSEARTRAILDAAVDAILTIDDERHGRVDEPGGRAAVRLPGRRGHRPERQDAHARAVPARARRLPAQLPDHRAEEDHRHRPRGGRPAQGRHAPSRCTWPSASCTWATAACSPASPATSPTCAAPSASSRTARPAPGPSWKRPWMRSSPSTSAAWSSR